jgi:hypothetical protein
MKTYYATTEQAESINGKTKKCKCDCGESYAISIDEEINVIICNQCYDDASYNEQYINVDFKF